MRDPTKSSAWEDLKWSLAGICFWLVPIVLLILLILSLL